MASAEEQLGLWKLVSDSVWQAISTQAEQERRAKAEKAEQSKSRRAKRGSASRASVKSVVPKPIAPVPKPATHKSVKGMGPTVAAAQPAHQQTQQLQRQPNGATVVQPRVPIAPISPVASSAKMPQAQQDASKPKPTLKAAAGGMSL